MPKRSSFSKKNLSLSLWLGITLLVLVAAVLTYEAFQRANQIVNTQDDVIRISAFAAIRAVERGDAILLDTRDAASFQIQHAKDALNLPLAEVEARLGDLDPKQYYITYCT